MAEGLLYRRRVTTRQPSGIPSIEWDDPITNGLVIAVVGSSPLINLASRRPVAAGNGVLTATGSGGRGLRFASSTNAGVKIDASRPLLVGAAGDYSFGMTMCVLADPPANTTRSLPFALSDNVAQPQSYLAFNCDVTLAASAGTIAFQTQGNNGPQLSGAIDGTLKLFTVTVVDAGSGVRQGVLTAGSLVSTAANLAANYADADCLAYVGGYSSGAWAASDYGVYLALGFNRALSLKERLDLAANPNRVLRSARSPVFYSLPGGGSTYPVSLIANGTISASDIRSVLRIRSASATSSASMTRVRALLRSASATATASASASKNVSLARAATATGTASISKARLLLSSMSASSTVTASLSKVMAIARTLTASATVTASRMRTVGLIRSAGAAASATLLRVVGLSRSATATGTAALTTIKAVLRAMSATATASASQLREVARIVTATSTVTATRSRLIALSRAASATVAAVRTRIIAITRSASATGTASLAQVKALLRTMSATATASAALARDLRRLVTVTVTVAAIRSRAVSMARTASSTATAVRSRIVGMVRSASAAGSAVLTTVKLTARLLSATATSTATLAKLLQKRLTATRTIQAVLTIVSSAAQQGQIAVDRLRIRIMPALRAIRRFRDG